MVVRGNAWTFFRNDCGACPWVNLCLRVSAFSHGVRQYFLSLHGFSQKVTPLMEEGSRLHSEEQERVGARTLDDYGVSGFFEALESGEELLLCEVPICARGQGLRGNVDLLCIRKVSSEPKYAIRITELKRSYLKPYIFQPVAYGIIFSDPTLEFVFKMPSIRTHKLKTVPRRVYPQKGPIYLDVDVVLQTLHGKRKAYVYPFMRSNKPTEWASGLIMAVRRKAKILRRFHKPGLYFLETLNYCQFCKRNENEECGFWEDICSRIPYKPHEKSKPLFFGKKQVLVKTKPKMKLDVEIPILKTPD